MLEEGMLEIYVDGSVTDQCGGVAVTIREIFPNGEEICKDLFSTQYINGKSGQLEIVACTDALKEVVRQGLIEGKKKVTIFTDSKYVAENYQEARFHWVGNSWFMKSGRPAPDAKQWNDLVKQLRYYYSNLKINVRIEWTKGHNNNVYNNAADVLAREAAQQPAFHYPKSNIVLAPKRSKKFARSKMQPSGPVKMDGQVISIKVLDCEYLRKGIWSYKYAVESRSSSAGFISSDKIFSKHSLEIGKTYRAKINLDNKNPWIEEIYP